MRKTDAKDTKAWLYQCISRTRNMNHGYGNVTPQETFNKRIGDDNRQTLSYDTSYMSYKELALRNLRARRDDLA